MTSALRWSTIRAILMFHNCEGQSHKTVSTDHTFWSERRAETDSNRGPSAYQPNALPLGQTGSSFPITALFVTLSLQVPYRTFTVAAPFPSSAPLHAMTLPFPSDRKSSLHSFKSNVKTCLFPNNRSAMFSVQHYYLPPSLVVMYNILVLADACQSVCVCVCVRACVRACVRVCVCARLTIVSPDKILRCRNALIVI